MNLLKRIVLFAGCWYKSLWELCCDWLQFWSCG